MISAKEAKRIAREARKEKDEKTNETKRVKEAKDASACIQYLAILEKAIKSEAAKGNTRVDFFVPYDNHFNEDVGKLIREKMHDFGVKINDGTETCGYSITVKWE